MLLFLVMPQKALAAGLPIRQAGPSDFLQVTLAFLTNLAIHESGHFVVAESVGARGNNLDFFSSEEGSFFLGISSVSEINEEAKLPYILGGEVAAGLGFEVALHRSRYRSVPTTYHRAFLFFSGTEFLWYSLYAFYLEDSADSRHDPVAISRETGLNPQAILAVAVTQSILNVYRVYSGRDHIIPYFTFDQRSASFWVGIRF